MTEINRVLGSLLVSTGSLILIMSILTWAWGGPPSNGNPVNMLLNLVLGSLGLTGGILLACNRKVGGILAIIAGAAVLILAIIPFPGIGGYYIFLWEGWDFYYFEPILLLVGGIIGTPSGKN